MSDLNNNNNCPKVTNIIRSPVLSTLRSQKPLPPKPLPLPKKVVTNEQMTPFSNPNLISITNNREARNYIKNQNRHTIAISSEEDYENVFSSNNSHQQVVGVVDKMTKLDEFKTTIKNIIYDSSSNNNKQSFDSLSKTPEKEPIGSGAESGSSRSSSRNALLTKASSLGTCGDSDHEMLESSATGLSGSGSNGLGEEEDESADDDLDSESNNNLSMYAHGGDEYELEDPEDLTIKRLKTFVATTLHNERIYLEKLAKLLSFRNFLEDNFNGSQADITVLFSGVQQIYMAHDIVACKLQGYTQNSTIDSNNNFKIHSNSIGANMQMKELFFSSALQLLANIMETSFPIYLEFLKNYSKAMTILNKLEEKQQSSLASSSLRNHQPHQAKSFIDCQIEFNRLIQIDNLNKARKTRNSFVNDPYNIYYSDIKKNKSEEAFDLTKIFAEEILRRPTKLFEFILSLREECVLASVEMPSDSCSVYKTNIKALFENTTSKSFREKVFNEINRNIMPKEVRKNEDVVELIETNSERKIRHLILYGDCLVCCRIKKDKRQVKWFIPIDHLGISLDEYKSAKSDTELRHVRENVVSLRSDLKKQTEENASYRNQQKTKKRLTEQENELTIQSSRLKLIVRSIIPSLSNYNHLANTATPNNTSSFFSSNKSAFASISNSMTNLANLGQNHSHKSSSSSSTAYPQQHSNNFNSISENNYLHNSGLSYNYSSNNNNASFISNNNNSNNSVSSNKFVFLFTSDFERIAWLEEINGAIYAFKTRKTTINLQNSDIESRVNNLKKIEEPPKAVISSCTGSLELSINHIEELSQPNKLFVAVELKSCGSYLQVAQTMCTDLITNPVWNEKFNLELQCVDSLRIILYCQTSSKALAIASQEIKIDSNLNLNKISSVKLDNGTTIHVSMKFLSPKKTITRRRTRNRNDIFGRNLADLLQREKSTIPRILKDCVEVIETKGIEEVGIYRVSSVVSEVQKMKDLYSKNPNQALNELRQKSPHLSANVLKLYLRELPDPLFTTHLYHTFMKALDCDLIELRQAELCRIFNDLPVPNKTIILFILTHLLNISNHSDKNMMGLQNLCTLFGPTLMKLSPKDNREIQYEDMGREIRESMQQAQVLFYLLQLHAEDRLITDVVVLATTTTTNSDQKSNLTLNLFNKINKTDNDDLTDHMTNVNLKSNQETALIVKSLQSMAQNNNSLNSKISENTPNQVQSQRAPPSRQNSSEKYAKLNMQTAL